MCDSKKTNSFLSGALFGALVGTVFGVLMAPEPGEKTRKKLKTVGQDYLEKGKVVVDTASAVINEVKDAAAPLIEQVEETVIPILKEAQKAGQPVKEEIMERIEQLASEVEDKTREEKDYLKKRFFKNIKK